MSCSTAVWKRYLAAALVAAVLITIGLLLLVVVPGDTGLTKPTDGSTDSRLIVREGEWSDQHTTQLKVSPYSGKPKPPEPVDPVIELSLSWNDGRPASHVLIVYESTLANFQRQCRSDDDGLVRFATSPGDLMGIEVPLFGLSFPLRVPSEGILRRRITLRRNVVVDVVVLDDVTGTPVGGAEVMAASGIASPSVSVGRTNLSGMYRVHSNLPLHGYIWARHESYFPSRAFSCRQASGAGSVELRLTQSGVRITGSVVRLEDHAPIPGAQVSLHYRGTWPDSILPGEAMSLQGVIADARGWFELRTLPPGASGYVLKVYADGYAWNSRFVNADVDIDIGHIALDTGVTVSGRVLGNNDAPVPDAVVYAANVPMRGWVRGRSDTNGYYTLRAVARGSLTMVASHPGSGQQRKSIRIEEQAQHFPNVDFSLRSGRLLRGRISGDREEWSGARAVVNVFLDGGGRWHYDDVPVDQYGNFAVACGDGHAAEVGFIMHEDSAYLDVQPKGRITIEDDVVAFFEHTSRRVSVTGHVEGHVPHGSLLVLDELNGEKCHTAYIDGTGRYAMVVPPGEYLASVRSDSAEHAAAGKVAVPEDVQEYCVQDIHVGPLMMLRVMNTGPEDLEKVRLYNANGKLVRIRLIIKDGRCWDTQVIRGRYRVQFVRDGIMRQVYINVDATGMLVEL